MTDDETAGWHHRLNGHEGQGKPGVLHTVHGVTDRHDLVTEPHFIPNKTQFPPVSLWHPEASI